jgi:hypothetical protein
MKIFETLLGHVLGNDITESDWWTDAVFRALEQEGTRADSAAEGNGYGDEPNATGQ